MKRIIISIITIAFSISNIANAQIIEEFDSNSLRWQEYASSRKEAVIKDGVLHIKSNNGKRVMSTCSAPIDLSEPFVITATLNSLKLLSDDKGLAIIFNCSDDYNCDVFSISKETISYIRYYEDKKIRFKDSDFKLNKKLKEHEIIVKYRNRKVELIIDDVQCLEVPYITINFNGFGFGTYGAGQEASIDKVVFKQM